MQTQESDVEFDEDIGADPRQGIRLQDQRRLWAREFELASETRVFELFSEFTGMVMVTRQQAVEGQRDSIQMRFNRSTAAKDELNYVFSVNERFDKYRQRLKKYK